MIALAETPVIQTPRLTLRAPVGSDWPFWSAFAQSDRARFIGGPYTAKTAWRAFGHAIGHWVMRGFGSFVFTAMGDDRPLGMTGPWHPEGWPEPELGWTIWSAEAEGTGLMFEAASAARDHAFTELGWATAVSYIDAPNARSVALAERLGATLDETAKYPERDDDPTPVLVYRHPAPDADGGVEAYA